MKSATFLCLFLATQLLGSTCLAQEKKTEPKEETQTSEVAEAEIKFIKDLDEAVRKTHETGKPLFVYVFDSI